MLQDINFKAAFDFYARGEYRESLHVLQSNTETSSNSEALRLMASCYLYIGDTSNALAMCDKAISLDPLKINLYGLKLDILRGLEQHHKILEVANEIELLDDSLLDISLIKANSYKHLEKPVLEWKENSSYLKKRFPDHLQRIKALQPYQVIKHVEFDRQYRLSNNLNFPSHVSFETFAKCNATCSFCVYPDMERIGQKMPDSLIEKIINDLTEIPRDFRFQLSPLGVNEPFLDKRIFSILEKIENKLPNADITITSNSIPLNQSNIERLSVHKLNYLWLSVVDHRKEIYEEKMKLSYETMLSRLEAIHNAKFNKILDTRIVVSRLIDNDIHDLEFKNFINQRFPLFEVSLWPYATWLNSTTNAATSEINDVPCFHWFGIRIDANGIVQHCCMDGNSNYPWGDVNKNSVLEIYNSEAYLSLRKNIFSRKDVIPCNTCNLAG
jgi:sulfatase maturation enzyme AslB (radical SAM superfamily)